MLPPPAPQQLLAVIKGPPPGSPREVIIENAIRVSKIIGSPGYPAPEDRIRADAIEGYDRAYYPAGIGRHFAAILGSGSLLRYDRQITAPTVVIHGRADKLMRPIGGRAVARAIRGARLVLFDGMGHELPEQLWDEIIGELKTNFAERPADPPRANSELKARSVSIALECIGGSRVIRRHRGAPDQPERHQNPWRHPREKRP